MHKLINKVAVVACLSVTTCLGATFAPSDGEERTVSSKLNQLSIHDTEAPLNSASMSLTGQEINLRVRNFVGETIKSRLKSPSDFSENFNRFYQNSDLRSVVSKEVAFEEASNYLFEQYRSLQEKLEHTQNRLYSTIPSAPTPRRQSPIQPAPSGTVNDTDWCSLIFKAYFENPSDKESTLPHTIQLTQTFTPDTSRLIGISPQKLATTSYSSSDYQRQRSARSIFSKNLEVYYTSFQPQKNGDTFLAIYHTHLIDKSLLPGQKPAQEIKGWILGHTPMYTDEYEAYTAAMNKFIFHLWRTVSSFGSDAVFYKVEDNKLTRVLAREKQSTLFVKFHQPLSFLDTSGAWRDACEDKSWNREWTKSLVREITRDIEKQYL